MNIINNIQMLMWCCIVIRLIDNENKTIYERRQENATDNQYNTPQSQPFMWITSNEDKEYYKDHPFVRQVMMFLQE